MKKIQKYLDSVTEAIGSFTSYIVFFMVLLVIITLFLRYVLNIGSVALQESIMYLHAFFFMAGISFSIKENSHVKIDILSQKFHDKKKNIVSILGIIFFMIPFSVFIIFISSDMVIKSWEIMEQSGEAGGLNLVYILKSIIPFTGILILLQSVSELIKNTQSYLK
ncbi:MAG: permease [Gammaproteobacteria bacterium]|nr:permease [Gammaproteobacteria bacterium]|tara:strand:+ start:927 stop:1421 length:495 start_codon:yes stop_codon:yes gene_type:complete